jgi:sterol desaturase/sphingolipid hydroxylase (fatty acid hydroxylase superfamily)
MPNEALIRLSIFAGLFAIFAALETLWPRRVRTVPRSGRWPANLALVAIDALVLRAMALALPFLAVGAAVDAAGLGVGLFNILNWNPLLEGAMAILILDFAIWAQHLITHKVPLFWRFHRVHHADRDFDVTTAVRFHPVEIAASMGLKIVLIYGIGPPALAVLVFEILLNGTALFNHANLAVPVRVDRHLRWVIVTPDMHRVHHSVRHEEHDSNFGFALSVWDRIFRTYRAMPDQGHDKMELGLEWQDDRPGKLGWSLWLPFR